MLVRNIDRWKGWVEKATVMGKLRFHLMELELSR